MGLLDAFTGKAAKRAAAENSARLGALKTEGMGYFDTGLDRSTAALADAKAPLTALGAKYGAGTDLYLDSLGVNGPDGNARAVNSFQAGPGYQWSLDEANRAGVRAASATGMVQSGNTLAALQDRAQGIAGQAYSDWQNKLGGLVSPEMTATTANAGIDTTLAGLYSQDALNRTNLASTVATGQNSQTTQAANAEMQGSANLWGLGLNLLKFGTGGAGGWAGAR